MEGVLFYVLTQSICRICF